MACCFRDFGALIARARALTPPSILPFCAWQGAAMAPHARLGMQQEGTNAFTVLQERSISVSRVALCPKMDLIALITRDGALVILRTIAWQKLRTVSAADFQNNSATAVAWSPDGNIVAVGHVDGTVTLLDVENGETPQQHIALKPGSGDGSCVTSLIWSKQHKDPAAMTADDLEQERSNEAARYYCERDDRFLEDLPAIGQQTNGAFAMGKDQKEETVGAKLASQPGLDVLVACFGDGRVCVLASGVYPLVTLPLPALLGLPAGTHIAAACPCPDLSALVLAAEHLQAGTQLGVLHMPLLWRARHAVKALAVELSSLAALVQHLQAALDAADRHWKDGIRVLEIKLRMFKDLLGNYGCSASMREAFLGLLASGVPTSALAQYLENNGSEAQRTNLYRLQKGLDDKCAAVEGLLRDQIAQVAEMVVFRASKLRGLALLGGDFKELGLCPQSVGQLMEQASRLSIKAEEALREAQQSRQNVKVFLLWLLDTMVHASASAVEREQQQGKRSFRTSSKHTSMLLQFLRRPQGPRHLSNTEEVIATQLSAYFQEGPLPEPFTSPEAEADLAALSLRQQVQAVQESFEALWQGPSSALERCHPRFSLVQLSPSTGMRPWLYPRPNGPFLLALHSPQRVALLALAPQDQHAWADKLGPLGKLRWSSLASSQGFQLVQACLYGHVPDLPSSNDEAVVTLAVGAGGRSLQVARVSLREALDGLRDVPQEVLGGALGGRGGVLEGLGAEGLVAGDVRRRSLPMTGSMLEGVMMDVTGSRGVACVYGDACQLVLLDLQEDEEEEEEEEEGESDAEGMDVEGEEGEVEGVEE